MLTLTASGDVSDYSDTSSLQQGIATAAGVDASLVTISVTAASVIITATIAVPANSVVNAIFGDITQDRTTRYDLRVEVAGEEANNVEDISPSELKDGGVLDFGIEYYAASSADGDPIWLTLAIVALGLLVIYGGVRTARSRGGTKF